MPRSLSKNYRAFEPQADESIAPALVKYFKNLPIPDSWDASSKPAAKRQKTSQLTGHYISVAREQLTVALPPAPEIEPIYRANSHELLYLRFDQAYGAGTGPSRPQLRIASRKGAPPPHCTIAVNTGSTEFNTRLAAIIRFAGERHAATDSQGALWTAFDISLSHGATNLLLQFDLRLQWNETTSPNTELRRGRNDSRLVIGTFYPEPVERLSTWSPMNFYSSAHVPEKDDPDAESIETDGVTALLYPYQKRTLQWLLKREGAQWIRGKGVCDYNQAPTFASDAFRCATDVDGQALFVHDLDHLVTRDCEPFIRKERQAIKGGILAEEMGLGKTLEIIGLITMHPKPTVMPLVVTVSAQLRSSKTTLIVTPGSLHKQWQGELARHAPHLRVMFYQGCKGIDMDQERALVEELCTQDVILTTYRRLSAELHYSIEPPKRSLRTERKYHRVKSPLVQILWWRVCLDEAQMVESTLSATAEVARLIPRINAWAVTGTPVKNDISDLRGLLRFLHFEPYCSHSQLWEELTLNKPLFQKLFNRLSLRHTKGMVRNELKLPGQQRYVISVPFTAVEEQHYQSLFQEMAEECGLDTNGMPLSDDWSLERFETQMSTWLNRLRQAALHPRVGAQNRQALGYSKSSALKTVDEVLDAMVEQNKAVIRIEQRSRLNTLLDLGQLLENGPRVREALMIWKGVRSEAQYFVDECRGELKGALAEIKTAERSLGGESEEDRDDEEVNKTRAADCRRRLRYSLEILHRAVFFCGNAYFQIREEHGQVVPGSDEFHKLKNAECDAYEHAKILRREILSESNRKAVQLIERITIRAANQGFVQIPELLPPEQLGIRFQIISKRLSDLYEDLNEQANQLDEWREQLIRIISKPLIDHGDDETAGDEFEQSTKLQDQLMVFVQAFRTVISDRQQAISGQANELVRHEATTAIASAKAGIGPTPDLLLELMKARDALKPESEHGSMRAAVWEIRTQITQMTHQIDHLEDKGGLGKGRAKVEYERLKAEKHIAEYLLKDTQKQLTNQTKVSSSLESELELYTSAMNARLEYYRQLQAISDSVLAYEGDNSIEQHDALVQQEQMQAKKIATAQSKQRYLLNLKDAGTKSNEPRICIICQNEFLTGVLTVCGHQFCKECMMLWFRAKRNCPVCKKHLTASNIHDITLKPQELKLREGKETKDAAAPRHRKSERTPQGEQVSIYSDFDATRLAAIQGIGLDYSYTTKVDAIARHLLWLRESDPGFKTIIFSQYQDFIEVLRSAFQRHKISFSDINDPNGIAKFQEDPSIECFLLHARAHSSGLNLVNANHVFLCEPILNTALELQAIARVDRIGQQNETTVWLYIVDGTVEESIYNLSVQRRMGHIDSQAKGKLAHPSQIDGSLDLANSMELETAAVSKLISKNRNFGEAVPTEALWQCLFGNRAQNPDGGQGNQSAREMKLVMSYLAAEAAEGRGNGDVRTANDSLPLN